MKREIRIKRHSFESINSTNSYLKGLNGGDADFDIEVATTDYQTAGRGQKGNSWESEGGKNLLFSILIHPENVMASKQFCLSEAISLAVVDTLKRVLSDESLSKDVAVKWPNDIYWKDKKIAGILIENDLVGCNIRDCIIGVGLNVNQEKFVSDAPNPVSLYNISGRRYDREELLNILLGYFIAYYQSIVENKQLQLHNQYKQSLFRREGFYSYMDSNGLFLASIEDVMDNGKLVLRDNNGTMRTYEFKEVSIVLDKQE
ncbi:MAG: biotin--[acetyl-CoA-carboxylase] ligase [Bacteroidaceae bacterium]|nr:biotin--[acetyl-CoA-carboxylase] ligase [Bacteroidaceae bacterium]